MSLNKRLSKIEEKTPMDDKVTFIGWADCEWREAEGMVRQDKESIEDFFARVRAATNKKWIFCH